MIRILTIIALLPVLISDSPGADTKLLGAELIPGDGVWIDPAIKRYSGDDLRVSVWFNEQFLGDGKSYQRRTKEFTDIGRIALRKRVTETLKSLSAKSHAAARAKLDELLAAGDISDLRRHWLSALIPAS